MVNLSADYKKKDLLNSISLLLLYNLFMTQS